MPVARSDPRRATIIGIVGVITGTLLIIGVLLVNNVDRGKGSTTTTQTSEFGVGPAKDRADDIASARTPLLFQDPANFKRPIFVQHFGTDPNTGWAAFDAAIGTCVLTWHVDPQNFTDCNGVVVPANGTGYHQYPWRVDKDGNLFVDLNGDATKPSSASSP